MADEELEPKPGEGAPADGAPPDNPDGGAPADGAPGEVVDVAAVKRLKGEVEHFRMTAQRLQAELANARRPAAEPKAPDPEEVRRFNERHLTNPYETMAERDARLEKQILDRVAGDAQGREVNAFLDGKPESRKDPEFATRMAAILDEMEAGPNPSLKQMQKAYKDYAAAYGPKPPAPGIPRTPPGGGRGAAGGTPAGKFEDGSDDHYAEINRRFHDGTDWSRKEMARLRAAKIR